MEDKALDIIYKFLAEEKVTDVSIRKEQDTLVIDFGESSSFIATSNIENALSASGVSYEANFDESPTFKISIK